MIGSILQLILGGVAKLLPFLFAYKAGADRVEKKNLEQDIKQGEIRNEIDSKTAGLDRAAILDKLRKLDADK